MCENIGNRLGYAALFKLKNSLLTDARFVGYAFFMN
jgi:hypothetical protein